MNTRRGKKSLIFANVANTDKFASFFGASVASRKDQRVSFSDIETFVKEIFRKRIFNFKRRPFLEFGLHFQVQADLCEMKKDIVVNSNHRYILIYIETFSRKLYTRPLKTKRADVVASEFEDIFKTSKFIPKRIFADEGSEFKGQCGELFKKHNIELYKSYTGIKASIAERTIRSLRRILMTLMFKANTKRWVDLLEMATELYNNRKHRGLKSVYCPNDINAANEKLIMETIHMPKRKAVCVNPEFKINSFVRISNKRKIFQKESSQESFSFQIYQVIRIYELHNPCTFALRTTEGREVYGIFYAHELTIANRPEIFLVEKIKKSSDTQHLCLLKGEIDEIWVDKKDITELMY